MQKVQHILKRKKNVAINNNLNHTKMQKNVIFAEKDSLKNSLEIKTIEKLEIIVVTQVDIELQPIVFVI